MIKADKYFRETIKRIIENGSWDKDPRPKWKDGKPAHSKFITQQVFKYDISKGEFPITTLRKTALKGAYYDIEAIYQKQTNIIEEMHPSIHSWWEDFSFVRYLDDDGNWYNQEDIDYIQNNSEGSAHQFKKQHHLGQTYGAIVKKYALMDKLLKGLEDNPFDRRHIIDMWQYHDQNRSPKSLVPCAYSTLWSVKELDKVIISEDTVRYIDLTLTQRSQDFMMTSSINPAQYVILGMMVCGHLTYTTGITHKIGNFLHLVQNCHIYDRHIDAAKEILERESINKQPIIKLKENKNFYDYTIDDFEFDTPKGIKKLLNPLELAI